MNPLPRLSTAALVLALVVLVACGGGGGAASGSSSSSTGSSSTGSSPSDTGPGQASVSIDWPERERSVPISANSVVVAIVRAGAVLKTSVVARPADGVPSVISFAGLPLGTLEIRITAYVSTNGTGAVLSVGTMPCTPVAGPPTPVPVTVTMAPIASSLMLSPSALAVPQGGTASLSVGAFDAAGAGVLFAADALKWTSDAPSVATVSGSGANVSVTGVGVGTTTVRVSLSVDGGPPIVAPATITVSGTGGTVTVH